MLGAGNTMDMTRYQEQFKKDVTAYIDMEETPLPRHAIGAMNTISEQMIRADLADNEDLDVNAVYSQNHSDAVSCCIHHYRRQKLQRA